VVRWRPALKLVAVVNVQGSPWSDRSRGLFASGGRELQTGDVVLFGDDTVHAVENPRRPSPRPSTSTAATSRLVPGRVNGTRLRRLRSTTTSSAPGDIAKPSLPPWRVDVAPPPLIHARFSSHQRAAGRGVVRRRGRACIGSSPSFLGGALRHVDGDADPRRHLGPRGGRFREACRWRRLIRGSTPHSDYRSNASAAAASSCRAVPSTSLGSARKSCRILHMP
jgi:hypothetical protein